MPTPPGAIRSWVRAPGCNSDRGGETNPGVPWDSQCPAGRTSRANVTLLIIAQAAAKVSGDSLEYRLKEGLRSAEDYRQRRFTPAQLRCGRQGNSPVTKVLGADGWMDRGLLLASLTSTFWQAKPRLVPTHSRNRTAASGEERGCPKLRWDLSPLTLQPPRDPKALWGSQAKQRGDQRGQVMEVLGTRWPGAGTGAAHHHPFGARTRGM